MSRLFAVMALIVACIGLPARAAPSDAVLVEDMKAACPAELDRWAAYIVEKGNFPDRAAAIVYYTSMIAHAPTYDREFVSAIIASHADSAAKDPSNPIYALEVCTHRRRLAQMDGAPLLSARQAPTVSRPAAPASQPSRAAALPASAAPGGAHNPAGEATDCIEPIGKGDFERRGVSSTSGAVLRNRCGFPVDVIWCIVGADCHPGYSNIATVPANSGPGTDRPIAYDPIVDNPVGDDIKWAACRSGFAAGQGALSRELQHACK